MATICYLPSSGSAPVSPTPAGADWTLHINTVSRPLEFTRGETVLTTLAYNPDAADHLVTGRSMIAQFVSQILPPQVVAAQQVLLGSRALENAAGNNLSLAWKVYAVSVDGTTNLGNIVAIRTEATEFGTSIAGACYVILSTATTLNVPWRLVLEVGVGTIATPVTPGGHNASIAFGSPLPTGAGNLPQNTDTTATTPVLIFSNDILTVGAGPISIESPVIIPRVRGVGY